jgi:hypothetical protein
MSRSVLIAQVVSPKSRPSSYGPGPQLNIGAAVSSKPIAGPAVGEDHPFGCHALH